MATSSFLCGALLLLFLFSFLTGSLGFSYTVGDSSGWTIPSESSLNYDRWASSHTFHIGDSLVFNYASGSHSVLQVTHLSYKECNVTSPFSTNSDGKTVIKLLHKGAYYFICGVPGHCQAGQKFQLKVVDAEGRVETSQAATKGNTAELAPSPAPSSNAIPPTSVSAPLLPHTKMTLMSFVTFTVTAYPLVHAFA